MINEIYNHIIRIFGDSIKLEVFPKKMKLAKVYQTFKPGKNKLLMNYGPASVLVCFSEILERITYNTIYKHLTKTNCCLINNLDLEKVVQPNML